jgi:hypothetical protein
MSIISSTLKKRGKIFIKIENNITESTNNIIESINTKSIIFSIIFADREVIFLKALNAFIILTFQLIIYKSLLICIAHSLSLVQ